MNISGMKDNSVAIVPFFNEEPTLGNLLKILLNFVDFIIAVNDGSTDNWKQNVPESNRVLFLHHSVNLGKGAALRTGIKKALELNFQNIVTIDADFQHDPTFVPKFLEKLKTCQIVVGNRLSDVSSMPLPRRASNFITSFLLSLKSGVKIKDSQCGFRAFRREVLESIIAEENGFEAESVMLIKAAKENFSICFVEIPTFYGNDNSKMKNLKAIAGFVKILFKY